MKKRPYTTEEWWKGQSYTEHTGKDTEQLVKEQKVKSTSGEVRNYYESKNSISNAM